MTPSVAVPSSLPSRGLSFPFGRVVPDLSGAASSYPWTIPHALLLLSSLPMMDLSAEQGPLLAMGGIPLSAPWWGCPCSGKVECSDFSSVYLVSISDTEVSVKIESDSL